MPEETLKQVLMRRDGMTEEEADLAIEEVREEALSRIEEGEDASDIMEEYFGLEPDYLEEILL